MQTMIPEAILIILVLFAYCISVEIEPPSLKDYGGEETELEEVPYTVSILRNNIHICGGIIIETQWILTTAHCVEDKHGLEIQAGLVNLLDPGKHMQKIRVKEVFLHPLYVDRNDSEYDIALLLLSKDLVYNLAVESISILTPTQLNSYIETQEPVVISGWGYSESADASVSDRLFSGEVDLLSNEECKEMFPNCEFLPGAHLCSSSSQTKMLAGYLDDGGPLVLMDKLGGLMIHGKDNQNKNHTILSTIYAGIPFHANFIKSYLPHLYPSKEEHSSSNLIKRNDSLKFDLVLVSVPSTKSIFYIETFILTYNIKFPDSWNIENLEKQISRNLRSQCSKKSDVGTEKWIFSIEIFTSRDAIEKWPSAFSPCSKPVINIYLAKHSK